MFYYIICMSDLGPLITEMEGDTHTVGYASLTNADNVSEHLRNIKGRQYSRIQ